MRNTVFIALAVLVLTTLRVDAAPSAMFSRLLKSLDEMSSGEAPPLPSEVTIGVDRSVVYSGMPFTLTWSSVGFSDCQAQGDWQGDLEASGSRELQSYGVGERIFSVQCTGDGGEVSSSLVTVRFEISQQQKQTLSAVTAIFSTL